MKKQSDYIKIIYFIKFFADAIFSGYLSMYFASKIDRFSFEYGILLGIIPFCALIGNFIWGFFSKNLKKNLLLIKIIISLESVTMLLFITIDNNFISLLISTILFGLFNSPCFSMQDGIGSTYSKEENVQYQSIRYMGSCGYLLSLIVGAGLITLFKNNYLYIFLIALILNLICLILWFFVKPFEDISIEEKKKVTFLETISNKTFVSYFIAYVLIIGCSNVSDSYLFSRLLEENIQEYQYSLVFASEVLLEIIVLILSTKFLKEKNYVIFLKISVIILCLRSILLSLNLPLPFLIGFACLRGIGWGGFLSVHILILRKIVSNKLITKAITLLTIALSLVNGLMTIFGTKIYSFLGINNFYLLLGGIQLIGVIIILIMKFNFKEDCIVK